ncbi:MAG: hypothetical protein GC160_23135 [Acidobacteria bacterium]|nr:hypothetical protein [Acidobacteriota bacterium]
MRTQVVEVNDAVGKLLGAPIFHPSGKKLLAKGHQVCEDDIRLLSSEGHLRVSVAVLEEGEVPEEEAALQIAQESARGSLEIRMAAGGRVNLHTTEPSCILVKDEELRRLNRSSTVTAATLPSLSYAVAGQRIGAVKTVPFGVPMRRFQEALSIAQKAAPLIEARPIRNPTVATLYCDPLRGERARNLFEGIMRTRLDRFGTSASFVLSSIEEEEMLARNLQHLLRAKPTLVLVASTTSPAGPEDAVGRAMRRVGCRIENFLAPVEPGNLLLLAYADGIPVVAAPGCFRSPRPNVVDLILPPLLARYPLTAHEISGLGHGGLLQ